ncbi:MAG: chaperone protein HtpG [marine bacterium B5-7]|nr:MAG: chaperone protein HtpG [marine bacterium B5-7]
MSTAQKETHGFQTEVKQLLHLMIHSLYSNKEIFLRELVSNASDAADKLRFEAIDNPGLLDSDPDLKIVIDINKDARTITIRDNGIGMNRDEVISNLGTIARSGTKEFMTQLSGDKAKDSQMIGQFGVGFYSAFIVADKVTVNTRRAGEAADAGICWESQGEGDYNLESITKADRGTEIIMHLKKDADEFLDAWRVRTVVTKYSDHIALPIEMKKEVHTDEEKEKQEENPEYEAVNQAKALWARAKADVKDEDYQEFYKHVSHDYEAPLSWSHNKVEGKYEYTSLLYIPSHPPFDMWNRDNPRGLKLYVQRVFIMDEAEQFLPMYLRFVKGVLDTKDLPLNISREILQRSKAVDAMKSAMTKRVLDMLEKMAKNDPENYTKFWAAFGEVIKEGPGEDTANKDRIAKLLRFSSTYNDDDAQSASLADYVERMREGQDKIYYITADTYNAAKHSPHLEVFTKKGIEVLLLHNRIDEWLVSHLTEFDGKQLQSVAKGDLDLGDLDDAETKAEQEQQEKDLEGVITQAKEILGDKIKDIRVTHRLTDSPACLVFDENEMSGHLQRIMQAAGQAAPASTPIFEVNPAHALISQLKNEQDDEKFSDWVHLLFDQALLAEGGQLDDPGTFVKRMNAMLLG